MFKNQVYTLCLTQCVSVIETNQSVLFNPLNAELNPILHLLALVGARHIVHVSRMRVNDITVFNLLNPTGHVMHQQFNIQQLYVLSTLYLCVLYLSENK